MAKTPLRQISVNTPNRSISMFSSKKLDKNKTHLNQESPSKSLQSIENNPPINDFNTVVRINSQQSIGVNTDHNPSKHDCSTNTPDYVDDLINNGLHMTEEEFKSFVQANAPDSFWKVMAERHRLTLEDKLNENQQLHEITDELSKENDSLRSLSEHYDYLTNVLNKLTSEHDSGIEVNGDETPATMNRTKSE